MKNKAIFGIFIGLAALFATPTFAFAQAYGYGGGSAGWGYNPYSNAGLYSYLSPLAQYGYGGGSYNPAQSTYTGQGYGYGAFGYQGQNSPYGYNSFNGYYPYTSQNCNYSFYGYQQQNCQNQNTGSGPQISNVSGPNSLSVGQQGTWSITTSAGAGNVSTSVRWGDESLYGNAMAASQQVATGNTFSHAYQQAGTYNITFTVTDGYGRSNSATTQVVVSNGGGCTSNCSGNFTATPTSGSAPLAVHFSGTMPGTSYQLDFGDGSQPVMAQESSQCVLGASNCSVNSISINSDHTYTTAGTYTARVTGTVSYPATIVVGGAQQGSLTATPASGSAPLSVSFAAVSDGRYYFGGFVIDYGDGSTYGSCGNSPTSLACPSHTYANSGTYTARLMGLGESSGGGVIATASVVVSGNGCTSNCNVQATLSASPTSGSAPLSVNFSTAGIDDNRYFYTLDFGDGSTPATMTIYATTAQHTYTQNGTYTATLKAAPNACYGVQYSCTQLAPTNWTTVGTVTISVGGGSTTGGSFTATPASGAWPLSPTFTATGLDSIASYYVDFGDRTGSQWLTKSGTTGTISHVYYITGSFTATLVKVTCNGAAYTSSCTNPTQTPVGTASVTVN